jgi:hypothetical protein
MNKIVTYLETSELLTDKDGLPSEYFNKIEYSFDKISLWQDCIFDWFLIESATETDPQKGKISSNSDNEWRSSQRKRE